MNNNSKRIVWVDIIKGICILFVLLHHSRAPVIYTRFLSAFFLTMFFFVSGYTFSAKGSFKKFIEGKVKRLLIPLLCMGAIKMVLACVIQGENLGERIKGLLFQIRGSNDDLWFIGCMFTTSMLFYGVVKAAEKTEKKHLIIILSTVMAAIGWVAVLAFGAALPWQLENALIMTFYMMLGHQYRQHEQMIADKLEEMPVILIFSGIYLFMVAFLDNDVNIHLGVYTMPAAHIFMTLLAIPVVVALSKKISSTYVGDKLQLVGKNTLFLYAFENYVIMPFYKVCEMANMENTYILSICCVAAIIIGLSPFIWIVNRYIPWMVGGKKG